MNHKMLRIALAVSSLLLASSCGEKSLSLQSYEKALLTAGIQIGPKEAQQFQLIGAKNGYGFSVEGDSRCSDQYLCRCEVYEFDTSIESGREALAAIKREGLMGIRMEFNKNLGMFCQGDTPQTKQAVSVLLGMQ